MNHIHSTNKVYKKIKITQFNKTKKKQTKRCEQSPVVCCGHGCFLIV